MSLARVAVENQTVTAFTTAVLLAAGAACYFQLGKLEDPEFTVKTAVVLTRYPGATAAEVELEVTDPLEIAIQEMPQLDFIDSLSRPGSSQINVEIQARYPSADLPQIWDELRKKIRDATSQLPPGAGQPVVADDFAEVYGFLLAVSRDDGFTDAELEQYVDLLKKELSLVEGVARVELWGVRQQCIYLDVQETQLTQLGISMEQIQSTLTSQNLVVDSGAVDLPSDRLRIEQSGAFDSPEAIGDLSLVGAQAERMTPEGGQAIVPTVGGEDELVRIRDIAQVRRGYLEPAAALMRFNGQPAIGVAISNVSGANIIELGRRLDQRLNQLQAVTPVGIEVERVSWQAELVDESIDAFMLSLAQAVGIVLVVLWLAMGLRTAAIVGLGGLVFVIVGSLLVMRMWGIDLQRMSLGALIIAMGMMVDNAIVVADGVLVRMQQGMDRTKAAIEAATLPAMPLLGATVIAVAAFYPIYASEESAGEYCASLFQVVAVALMLSWVLSVTVIPLMCIWLLPDPDRSSADEDPYAGGMFALFRRLLGLAIRFRLPVLGAMLGLLVLAGVGFTYIDNTFFPDSARLQLMVDYWAPQGTRIETVTEDLRVMEEKAMADERVTAVSAFIGQGPPRFYLPVEPERAYSSYAQLILNLKDIDGLNSAIPDLVKWSGANLPEARIVVRRYGLGPSETWSVEARISGPAGADLGVLRKLGEQGAQSLIESPHAFMARTNWRQRVMKVQVDYSQERGRWAGISRSNIGRATLRAYDGFAVGQYREDDKLMPIVLRSDEADRARVAGSLRGVQVHPTLSSDTVPLAQVVDGIELEFEDVLIWRRNRRRTVTIEARPPDGVPASVLRNDTKEAIESIELPPGYELDWGGEFESSRDAQQSLIPGMIPAAVIVAITVVALFNALRPPLIIFLVIPFALIGVTIGLLVTDQPFGFLALLGAMSLAGMMIKNAIVLLDQINIEKASGKNEYDAVVEAALSRLRPVVLAAATTVLGVIPLLGDVFWVAMAVTIMFGLAFGTLLTMFLLPVLYTILFRVPSPADK